ncbi:MAG: NADH-quinone oxidoreductase subunit NuoF [Dissulfurispiraceae bacterium]
MQRPLTAHIHGHRPFRLRDYEKSGGYRAVHKALRELAPDDITAMVKNAKLRGRGGAGFPTGLKWSLMPEVHDSPRPRYLVINADEMEPGTFKDRLLLEGNPHQMIEAAIVAAYALQADTAYIFLRWEYKLAAKRLTQAIAEAYENNYLGNHIQGSGFSLQLHLHVSAGRYMCGEETGLLNSLEGKRAIPRSKPPHATTVGLLGKPTVINNVETLCNIPHIVINGDEWFRGLSHSQDGGTKIYGVSGRVKRPGAWELPMGSSAREVIEGHAGGMTDGFKLRGIIPGGASTNFITEEHIDIGMDYDSLQKVGSRMGTGTMIVLDDKTCPVGMVLNLESFFARESCGWCTPCREGLPWVVKTLQAIEEGNGQMRDLEILQFHADHIKLGHTFCALAPGAMEPLESALRYYREDFQQHIRRRRCPWK